MPIALTNLFKTWLNFTRFLFGFMNPNVQIWDFLIHGTFDRIEGTDR